MQPPSPFQRFDLGLKALDPLDQRNDDDADQRLAHFLVGLERAAHGQAREIPHRREEQLWRALAGGERRIERFNRAWRPCSSSSPFALIRLSSFAPGQFTPAAAASPYGQRE